MAKPTDAEIEQQISKALEANENDFYGMTYIEGVREALDWVTGHSDQPPLETE